MKWKNEARRQTLSLASRSARAVAFVGTLVFSHSISAHAFPEMIRHGYFQCTSCHVSPTGGGVLTPYGRELSKEILSTFGRDGEQRFAYFIDLPEALALGGDVRTLQMYRDSPTVQSAQIILMQADFEMAATVRPGLSAVATLGLSPDSINRGRDDLLLSRRHYLLWQPFEMIEVRGGRFFMPFGLATADHAIATRRSLSINEQGTETYNLEVGYLRETFNLFVAGVFGRPDNRELNRETGLSIQTSIAIGGTARVGLSGFAGSRSSRSRQVTGPFAAIGISPKAFWLFEADFQHLESTEMSPSQWGWAQYQRLDYEFVQGLHGYLSQEYFRPDFESLATLIKTYGIGIQWFFRPHWELQASWQIQIDRSVPGYTDLGGAQLHFYF